MYDNCFNCKPTTAFELLSKLRGELRKISGTSLKLTVFHFSSTHQFNIYAENKILHNVLREKILYKKYE